MARILAQSRLRTKLTASYAAVIAIAVVTFAATVKATSPLGHPPRTLPTHAAVSAYTGRIDRGLAKALVLGVLAGLTVGVVAAVLITRLIVGPLDRVRTAARYMMRGHYGTRVPVPRSKDIARMATDINALAARLDTTERRRAGLVSDVAHELRTPLTILRLRLDGIAEGVFTPSPELVTSMSEEVARLERLTGDLARVSRAGRPTSTSACRPSTSPRSPPAWSTVRGRASTTTASHWSSPAGGP